MTINSNSSEEKIPEIQIVTLGEANVGKTSIILRYSENKFSENYLNTVGVDFRTKNVEIEGGKQVTLKIWDTAGQEKFRAITKSYIGRANGILVVFDVSSRLTFKKVQDWIDSINELGNVNSKIVLIGNKCDLERAVSEKEAEIFAYDRNVAYFSTSAKDGTNINAAFEYLAKNCQIQKPITEPLPVQESQKCKC